MTREEYEKALRRFADPTDMEPETWHDLHNDLKAHDAALRARCTELEQAVEVIQSSRDICLNTFTAWCTEQYGPAKHALRMEPEYKKRIEALEQALRYCLADLKSHVPGAVTTIAKAQQALAQREVKHDG